MRHVLLFVAALIVTSSALAGPRVTGNSGDVVMCEGALGYQSLDYVIGVPRDAAYLMAPVRHIDQSLARITKLLQTKAPELAASFAQYVWDMKNLDYFSRVYHWRPAVSGEFAVLSQGVQSATIPASCGRIPNGGLQIRPVIMRSLEHGKVRFDYDLQTLRELDPLQLSFVLVHEWLWDITKDAHTNRSANVLLHSRAADGLSRDALENALRQLGLL